MPKDIVVEPLDIDDLASQYEATFISDELPQEASDKIRNNEPDSTIDDHILLILDQR